MVVGYTGNHSRDVYRVLNLETHGIINSQDIVWLNKMHKDWITDKSTIRRTVDNDYDDLPIIKHVIDTLSREESPENDDDKTNINKRVYCQLKKLDSWFNP